MNPHRNFFDFCPVRNAFLTRSAHHARMNESAISVCAHAGCEGSPPDGLESIAAAIASGAEVVEIDVRADADGRLVLSHDPIRPEAGAALVSFEAALEAAAASAALRVNIDLKEHDRLPAVRAALDRTGMAARCYLTGIEPEQVPLVRRDCPGIPFGVDYSRKWLRFRSRASLRGLVLEARMNGAAALNLNHRVVSARLAAVCRAAGFPLHVWTADDEGAMRRLIGWGVSSITTRRPVLLRSILRETEARA